MILTSLVIALAAGGMAVTITRSKLFASARARCRSELAAALVRCPYCVAHWLVAAATALYRPRLVRSRWPAADVVITMFATITVAVCVAAVLCRVYSFVGDPRPVGDAEARVREFDLTAMSDKPTNQRLQEGALTPASSPKQPPAQATLVPLRPAQYSGVSDQEG